jgi:outer membrane protein TolC
MAKEEDIIRQTDQQITLIREQIDLIYQQYKAGSLTIIKLLEFQRQLNNASLTQALAKYRYDVQLALKLYWSGRLSQL